MTKSEPNFFLEFLKKYRDDPVGFVRDILRTKPDPWQIEFLKAISAGNRRISVRSGHGVGKSTAASWAMLHYFLTRYPVKVVVTAPTSAQLFDAMFAELKRWVNELPDVLKTLIEVKADRIELKAAASEAFISARTSRAETPEALQGIHADNVLLVAPRRHAGCLRRQAHGAAVVGAVEQKRPQQRRVTGHKAAAQPRHIAALGQTGEGHQVLEVAAP